jgi:hypothetical protein
MRSSPFGAMGARYRISLNSIIDAYLSNSELIAE